MDSTDNIRQQQLFLNKKKARLQTRLSSVNVDAMQILQNSVLAHLKKQTSFIKSDSMLQILRHYSAKQLIKIYSSSVDCLIRNSKYSIVLHKQINLQTPGFVKSKKLMPWKKRSIVIDRASRTISVLKQDQSKKSFSLSKYMVRLSKGSDKYCFCLTSFFHSPVDNLTFYFGFATAEKCAQFYELSFNMALAGWLDHISKLQGEPSTIQTIIDKPEQQQPMIAVKQSQPQTKSIKFQNSYNERRISITQAFLTNSLNLKPHLAVQIVQEHLDLIPRLLPELSLENTTSDLGFRQISIQPGFRVLVKSDQPSVFKIYLTANVSQQILHRLLASPNLQLLYNQNVEYVDVKNFIATDNSAVIYQKHKPYGYTYRARDFVYMRHVCIRHGRRFILDTGIDSVNFPPYLTIVRARFHYALYSFQDKSKGSNRSMATIDLKVTNEGLLSVDQDRDMTLQFVKGLRSLLIYIDQQTDLIKPCLFDMSWTVGQSVPQQVIEKDKCQLNSIMERQQQKIDTIELQIEPQNLVQVGQTEQLQEQVKTVSPCCQLYVPELDQSGRSLRRSDYLHSRHPQKPLDRQLVFVKQEKGVWKGEWIRDNKYGGMIFINQTKLNEQKKVLKYIVQKIGKNIMTGKSILSISLPVDIFSPLSNLELFAKSFGAAAVFLQEAGKADSPISQFKKIIAFLMSTSILYIEMEKPFNPILGQTFQAFLGTSLAYFQQISHHPPVSAFQVIGKHYQLSGALESKVQLKLNSAIGINQGQYSFKLAGAKGSIKASVGGGQLLGLVTGDRKLNLSGKTLIYQQETGLMCQLAYNPHNKGMFSYGSPQNPIDWVQGQFLKVNQSFLQNYRKNKYKSPTSKDILERLQIVKGNWDGKILMGEQLIFDANSFEYVGVEQVKDCLESDCNYRQDIIYRRLGNYSRSQTQKERLQELQRRDRKLREDP